MDDNIFLLSIVSGLISLFILIFVLVKLHQISANTRKYEPSFNHKLLYQYLLIGDQESIKKFMEEETIRLIAQGYYKERSNGFFPSLDHLFRYIPTICKEYNLELPEVLVKFDTEEKIKELLK